MKILTLVVATCKLNFLLTKHGLGWSEFMLHLLLWSGILDWLRLDYLNKL